MNFLVTFCSGAYCLPLHRLGSELVHVSFAHAAVTIATLFCVDILFCLFMDRQSNMHIYTFFRRICTYILGLALFCRNI